MLRDYVDPKPGHEDEDQSGGHYGDLDHQDAHNKFTDNGCTFHMDDKPGQCRDLVDFPEIPPANLKMKIKAKISGQFHQRLFDTCCKSQEIWDRPIPFSLEWSNDLNEVLSDAVRRGGRLTEP